MPSFRRLLHRLLASVRTGRAESELTREIDAHLRLLEDDFVAKGLPRREARLAARRAFGGVEQAKEHQRDARAFRWLVGWPMDLRLGVRMLARTPGLTVIGVIALAVAIGAGATYLEFVNDLIRPALPAPGAERIVGIRVWDTERRETDGRVAADFVTWRREATAFEALGAMRPLPHHLIAGDGMAERTRSIEISAAAFRIFPAAPIVGRTLAETDEAPSAAPVAVIGEDVWARRFNSDPAVIGQSVRLGTTVYTIVGVMPAHFGFPINQNLWVPLKLTPSAQSKGDTIQMFGRLREGVSPDVAQAELGAMLSRRAARSHVEVRPYLDSLMSLETSRVPIQKVLYSGNLLFVMLLVICGANVATLVFGRTALREAEITVRTALGASRGRIGAQLFAEALVLSLLAAVAGLVLAAAIGRWLAQGVTDAIGQPLPFWWNGALSLTTVLYALLLAVFAAMIVGVLPALKATGGQLQQRLREAGATGSTMTFGRLWTTVIVTQVAITVVFLSVGLGLGWETYAAGRDHDVTFPRREFLTAPVVLTDDQPAVSHQSAFGTLAGSLRADPRVVQVSYATEMPGTTFGRFRLEFATPAVAADAVPHEDGLWVRSARVGPDYFEAVGATLVAGRVFTGSEVAGNRPVVIVDETFVRLILGGRNPLGVMLREAPTGGADAPGPWAEIVGVVADVTVNPRKKSYDGMVYVPSAITAGSPMQLLVRTHGSAAALTQTALAAAAATPAIRVEIPKTLDQVAENEALASRMAVRALVVVSAVALLLSMAGIYALVSFTLARRTREIGIRVALGAAPRRIITDTFSRAFAQVGLGVMLGTLPGVVLLVASNEETGGMAGPGVGVMLALGLCVVGVALLACVVPLRRALRIEPTRTLRADG